MFFAGKNDGTVSFDLSAKINEIKLIYCPSKWLKYNLRVKKLDLSRTLLQIYPNK